MARKKGIKNLGSLCIRGHNHNETGRSLRYKDGKGACVECVRLYRLRDLEKYREYHKLYARRHRLKNKEHYREYKRVRHAANPEKNNERCKRYRKKNKSKITAHMHQYYLANKRAILDQHNEYKKKQRNLNTSVAIAGRIRCSVAQSLRKYSNTGKIGTANKYGIDYKAILDHLGPHPNTRGIKGDFQIDHIIPLSSFDLNDPEQIKLAFAPGNHQWMKAKENKIKGPHILGQLNLGVQKQLNTVLLKEGPNG